MTQIFRAALLSGGFAILAGPALAAQVSFYSADLVELNESGVSGTVFLTFDRSGEDGMRSLLVEAAITGLKPGPHAAHIHGFAGDDRKASIAPTADVFDPDAIGEGNDGDGFTELSEGGPFYGGILQTLTDLEADDGGRAFYNMAFDIAEGSELDDDLFSLDNREIVVHGLDTGFAPVGAFGAPDGDIDAATPAEPNFNALLPIATAKFERSSPDMIAPSPVPLPAAVWMLLAAVGGLGAIGRFRRGG